MAEARESGMDYWGQAASSLVPRHQLRRLGALRSEQLYFITK